MPALTGIELVYQMVQDDIRRPDLQEKIWRRIHRSALSWHRADDWKRDFEESQYIFDLEGTAVPQAPAPLPGAQGLFMNWAGNVSQTLNVQVIRISDLIRFRKVGYMRRFMTVTPYGTAIYDPTTGQQGTVQGGDLLERSPDSMTDGYGYDKTNVFYRSGDGIIVNSATPLNKVFLGYFKDPIVNMGCTTEEEFLAYTSWIIDSYPELVAVDVKAKMFNDTGKVEEANAIRRPPLGELPIQELRLRSAETRVSLR